MRRRRRPSPGAPPGARLEIEVEHDRYSPGETVRGSVVPAQGGGAGEIEVSLNFHERSTRCDAVTISTAAHPVHAGELVAGNAYRFETPLPEDAPPSHTSKHGALWWTVDARIQDSEQDRVVSRRIEVVAFLPSPPPSSGPEDA